MRWEWCGKVGRKVEQKGFRDYLKQMRVRGSKKVNKQKLKTCENCDR